MSEPVEANVTHTPGPWDDASKYPNIQTVRIFAGMHYIASVGNSDDGREQTEANARLIAAAPDLLNALKLIESVYRQNCVALGEPSSVLEAVQAAIAKAEGR